MTPGAALRGGKILLFQALLVLVLLTTPLRAEEAGNLKGVALVIGQSNYAHIGVLPNPVNDARDMVKLLTDLGFDARSVSDRDAKKLKRDLERFVEDAEGADVAFLYYSGHGIESGGENWLVPVDADVGSLDNAAETLVPLSSVMDELKAAVPVTVMLLDACRTNPFPPGATIRVTPSGSAEPIGEGGLTPVRGAKALTAASNASENLGTVIGFAAEPGRPALDGTAGQNSPYAAALLRHLAAMKGVEFGSVMRMVTEEVYLDTKARQRPWVNESLRRLLYFGVAPDEPEGDEGLITGERRKLLLTISALPDVNRAQIETVAVKDDVPLDALFGVLRAMGTENIPEDPAQLGKILDQQSVRLKAMFAEKAALRTDDPEIARLTESADRAMRQGAIEASRKFLDEAVARIERNGSAVDAAEDLVKQKRLADAAIYVRRADASALAFDYRAAATDYGKAYELVERWDDKLRWNYKNMQAEALHAHGQTTGDSASLEASVAAYRQILDFIPNGEQGRDWAITRNNMAIVYQTIGERQADTARLVEAADIFRQSLTVFEREKDDLNWAAAQNNIGNALLRLGQRDKDGSRLSQAVAAFRATLEKRSRDKVPLDWASSQNNIGIALSSLGERETTDDSLVASEAAYRLALEVYSLEKNPVEWAMVQNNLGNTLLSLGMIRNDQALFDAATQAFRNALQVRTREHFPLSWAASMVNLGNALSRSTQFDFATGKLEQAAAAYLEALSVYQRKRFPLEWASTQNNLGSTYQSIGQRTKDAAILEDSASAFRAARKVYKRKDFPLDWAMVHYNLGRTLEFLGAVTGNPERYKDAVLSYGDAISGYERDKTPRQWALAQAGLGSALQWLSNNETDTGSLVESIAARRAALEVFTPENAPVDWATVQSGLGMTLLNLGSRERTAKYSPDALAAVEASLTVFTRKDQPLQWAFGQNTLGDLHWNIASYGGGGSAEFETAIAHFEDAKAAYVEQGYLLPIPLTDQKIEIARKMMAEK